MYQRRMRKDLAFYVLRNDPGADPALPKDALSQAVLSGLPALFDRQILQCLSEVGTERLLPWLQNRFRNSLHVSLVGERSLELRAEADVHLACIQLYPELVLGQPASRTLPPRSRGSRVNVPLDASPAFMVGSGFSFKISPIDGRAVRAVG